MPDEAPEELNAAVLLNIDAELSTNEDKPSDAEILAEVQGEAAQEEETDDIDVVYDELPEFPSALELNRAIEVLQQFTLFCDEGDNLREVLVKVKRYSQKERQ